ncbi:calmodulin-binding transcription activator 3-like isoform X2 [Humulus lupulus]|nr:calmodulin-binding transcription activator 3-like isoform X2 [Humulus lupulus]
MLDGLLENIVLVHYREVREGYKSGISRLQATPRPPFERFQNSCGQANSPVPTIQNSFATNANRVDWNGPTLSLEVEDVDSGENSGASLTQTAFGSISHNAPLLSDGVTGVAELSRNHTDSWYPGFKLYHSAGSSLWAGSHGSTKREESMHDQKCDVEEPGGAEFIIHKLTDSKLDVDSKIHDIVSYSDKLIPSTGILVASLVSKRDIQVSQDLGFNSTRPPFQCYSDPQMVATFTDEVEKKSEDKVVTVCNNESAELKKLDSFGRWMDKEIGVDCDDSLMASDSGNYWNTLDAENDDKEVSSLSHHMQLEIDSLGPSLSQEQLFSICDISPDWTYPGVETKVLIAGRFLGSNKHSSETKWGCMFGEIEVPAEVVIDNVIRCKTPLHAPGRVPFYVTCSNRLACSEVREFEYREKPQVIAENRAPEDELRLQIRLGKLLNLSPEMKSLNCSGLNCDKCNLIGKKPSMRIKTNHLTSSDILIQNLLKDRLHQWLVFKTHEEGKGPNVFDDEGLGVIHLAAALGYQWAIGPIIAAGVSPNFRDARGKTALHWASCFGREETVVALVRLGAAPGAVNDPTPAFPGGQTAADLASINGHKGIAGYLAEADLTSHLSSLNINENVADIHDAIVSAESAIDTESKVVSSELGIDNHFLEGSLAAFRKSAHTAALIQAAFRNHLLCHKQLTKSRDDVSNDSVDLVVLDSLNKVQKSSHFEDYLHSAAKKIQKKYRGWKGRKEFLHIRSRIVKIQAHVRGHQVRKQYKKLVWSVSILEKVILRWRRKGSGLRGFRVEKSTEDESRGTKRSDDYEYLIIGRKQKYDAVDKALARVKSMVRHPEAREQYMRLVTNFEKFEIGEDESSA